MLRLRREAFWFVPFVGLALMALTLMRPWPRFPPPGHSREVADANGVIERVPLPFRAITSSGGSDFLELSHAPDALAKAGNQRSREWFASGLMSRIYPGVLANDALWDFPPDIESTLAQDPGATYFVGIGDETLLRRVGLSVLRRSPRGNVNRDETVAAATRVVNDAAGTPDQGRLMVARYRQAYVALVDELQPGALARRPRVLDMYSSAKDRTYVGVMGGADARFDNDRIGIETASDRLQATGRQQDAERVLLMNPDVLVVGGETVDEFLADPRWVGLKAVQDRRVYPSVRTLRGAREALHGLDIRPLWARWRAEIAHGDRLQPRMRAALLEHYQEAYGYRLSDAQVDDMLRLQEGAHSQGYARFGAAASASAKGLP